MIIAGPVWIPPPLPIFDKEKALLQQEKGESENDDKKDHEYMEYFKAANKQKPGQKEEDEKLRLPYQLKRELTTLLDELTVKQTDICTAMIFIMENTEYYKPIVTLFREKIAE